MIKIGALLAPVMSVALWSSVAGAEPPDESPDSPAPADSEAALAAAYATFRAGEPPPARPPEADPEYTRAKDPTLSNVGLFLLVLGGAGVLASTVVIKVEADAAHGDARGAYGGFTMLFGSAAVAGAGAGMFLAGRKRVPLGESRRPQSSPEPEAKSGDDVDLADVGLVLIVLGSVGVLVSGPVIAVEGRDSKFPEGATTGIAILLGSAAVGGAGAVTFLLGRKQAPLGNRGPTPSSPSVAVGLSGIHGTF